MGRRARSAALTLTVVGVVLQGGCDGPPAAEAARTPFEQHLADSLAGDSAAFASLPEALGAWLDVRAFISEDGRSELAAASCTELESLEPGLRRRRLSLRLADTSSVLLYAVAERGSGTIDRVEYIRSTLRQGQRGLVWDAARNRTFSTWWIDGPRGRSRRVERGEIPRGGPVPRALRGMGRQLFVAACDETPPADAGAVSPR